MTLPADAERFNHLTEGLKNIVFATAVFFGGLWTAYQFFSLKTIELARLNYEQKKERRPALEVGLATELIDAEVDDYYDEKIKPRRQLFIQLIVSVRNAGNFPALVNISNESVVVSRLNSGTDNVAYQTASRSFNVLGAKGRSEAFFLSPGNKTEFQYMIDVRYSGLHIVEFRVPQDPSVLELLAARGSPTADVKTAPRVPVEPAFLSTTKIVFVPSARLMGVGT